MYEFRDGDGELVTVRSLRTLERLLADSVIRTDTPFRAGGEAAFVPAAAHPAIARLAADMGLPFAAPAAVGTEQHRSQAEVTESADADPGASEPEPVLVPTLAVVEVRPQAPKLVPGHDVRAESPWRLPLQRPARQVRQVARSGQASGRTVVFVALAWLGGSLLLGVLAYAVASGAAGSGLGVVAALVIVAAVAQMGGMRLRRSHPSAGPAPVWIASVTFACVLALGGLGGFAMALIADSALIFGWRKEGAGRG